MKQRHFSFMWHFMRQHTNSFAWSMYQHQWTNLHWSDERPNMGRKHKRAGSISIRNAKLRTWNKFSLKHRQLRFVHGNVICHFRACRTHLTLFIPRGIWISRWNMTCICYQSEVRILLRRKKSFAANKKVHLWGPWRINWTVLKCHSFCLIIVLSLLFPYSRSLSLSLFALLA